MMAVSYAKTLGVVAVACLLAAACSGGVSGDKPATESTEDMPVAPDTGDPIEAVPTAPTAPVGDPVAFSVAEVARFPGLFMGLSPTGDHIVQGFEGAKVCVFELPGGDERYCREGGIDEAASEQMLTGGDLLVWAQGDPSQAAFSASVNPDVSLFDLATGAAKNINDDGYWDQSTESIGSAPSDGQPAWLIPGETLVFLQSFEGRVALAVLDAAAGSPPTLIELPEVASELTGNLRPRVALGTVPLVIDANTVLLSGNGAVFEVNIADETVGEIVDYSATFESVANADFMVLQAVLDDGTVLAHDGGLVRVLGRGDLRVNGPMLYTVDLATGVLTPVFESGPWLAGSNVWISPTGRYWIVSWIDPESKTVRENASHATLAIIDTETVAFPVAPQDLPVLWNDDADTALWWQTRPFLGAWTTQGTFAVSIFGSETVVFKIE